VPVRPGLPRCRRFRGEAAFGKDTLLKQTFYGFRMHARVCWPGVITRLSVAPANAHELHVLPELVESTSGLIVGDRNYHSPRIKEELTTMGVELLAPYSSSKKLDPKAMLMACLFMVAVLAVMAAPAFAAAKKKGGCCPPGPSGFNGGGKKVSALSNNPND
jgi:Transposase DDE domain